MKKKKSKYETPEGLRFLEATNPQAYVNTLDKMSKKPPKQNKRPRYPRDVDRNPRSRG